MQQATGSQIVTSNDMKEQNSYSGESSSINYVSNSSKLEEKNKSHTKLYKTITAPRITEQSSFEVQQFTGRDVPERTKSNRRTAMRALDVLLIHGRGENETIPHTDILEPSTGVFVQLQKFLFPSDDEFGYRCTGYNAWDD